MCSNTPPTSNGWHKVLEPPISYVNGEVKPSFVADKEEAELVAQWLEDVLADLKFQFYFVE